MNTEVNKSGLAIDSILPISEIASGPGVIGSGVSAGSAVPTGAAAPPRAAATKPQPAIAELLTKETPANYFGVFHMLVAFVGMTVSTMLILFANSALAFPLCLAIYIGMTVYEAKHRIYSPVSFSLIVFYTVLYGLFMADSPYLPYFGLASFAWLSVLGVGLFAIGKPLTTFYTHEHGSLFFHRLISGIWTAAFILSFIAGYLLMPSVWYLIVPFAICFGTCAFVIYLNLFDTRLVTRRAKEFTKGDYTFREIEHPSKAYEDYLDFYCEILPAESIGPERPQTEEEIREFKEYIRYCDGYSSCRKVIFGAYRDGKLVGTLGIVKDARENPFLFEKIVNFSIDPLRKIGGLMDIGRFCIAPQHRKRTEVIEGLFKCVLEYALEHDACFLMAEVLSTVGVTYARLGFESLIPRSDPRAKTMIDPMVGSFQILFNNLAQAIFFQKNKKVNASLGLFTDLNDLLAERWVKRMVVRHALSPKEKLPWMHTVSSLRMTLGLDLGRR